MSLLKKYITLCVCFFISLSQLVAQSTKGFNDPTSFLKDLESFFGETNKKEAEKIMDAFDPVFSKFSGQQQQSIISTSNAMLKKRMKAFPDFEMYVNALTAFASSGQSPQTFTAWHDAINKGIPKLSVKRNGDFMESCYALFNNNTLYESNAVKWTTDNNKYEFQFDSLPKIILGSLTLTGFSKGDSTSITGTKGVFYPNNLVFYGDGGKVNFTRAGLSLGEAFADVKKYAINMKGSEYTMDSVSFSYKKYFPDILKGRYMDKLLANTTDSTASYPRFFSYATNLTIKDLIKDADYKGGFSLQGSKMVGSGSRTQDASLTFNLNDKPQMTLRSRGFIIRPDRMVSTNAAVVIYWEKDSIYHPGLEFKYIYKDKIVTLTENNQTGVSGPYFDSYHKMDLEFEQLVWKVTDPLMDLKMITGAGENKLRFESVNYFSRQRFDKIQGISEVHPLFTIKQFCEKFNTRVVHTNDLAQYMKLTENTVRNLLIDLSALGFLSYDADDDRAIVKDKVFYYLSARSGKVDYDEIKIESLISGQPNATINLLNFDIDMRGVSRVLLSDSQEVYIVPYEQQLTLKKNRDIKFAGRVHAGGLDFYGKEFAFSYEDFNIDLKTVDSLRFKVPADSVDQTGKTPIIPIKSVIQQLMGKLSIDNPSNKSGFVANENYPIFDCTNKPFIYYDYASIFNAVYKRDKFYLQLDPFMIDSLNTLTKRGLVFESNVVSAGIFPDFKQTATVQPDYSIGFVMNTPEAGFLAYGGKGKYKNEVSLSHKGFLGKGDIEYLSSTSTSNDIVFFPDSTHANTQQFVVRNELVGTVKFPDIKAEDVFVNWQPRRDKMYVFKKSKDFALYNGQASLDGDLILMPGGITANGTVTLDQSQLISSRLYLKDHNYGSDSASFNLRNAKDNLLALESKNLKADIDVQKREGNFSSNGNDVNVSFPVTMYVSSVKNFKWFMDKAELQLGKEDDASKPSEFISVHPNQDSLRFTAPLAKYNINDYVLSGYQVKEILVADASIIPNEGTVVVQRDALMRTLNNSAVLANTTSKYHTMLYTDIDIQSRKSYTGTGDYEYMDQAKVKHMIKLTQIGVDTSKQTFAVGEIPDSSNFSISPTIQYKGKIRINAAKQNLYFSGFANVNHHCDMIQKNWFGFASDIDPKGVNIPVIAPVNEASQKLYSGLYFGGDSTSVYPAFISQKQRSTDGEIISAEGLLTYDDVNKKYRISGQLAGEKDKAKTDSNYVAVNNIITLDDKRCSLTGDGKINLTTNLGEVKLNNYGQVVYQTVNDSIYFDVVMTLDFLFNDDALKVMAEAIEGAPALKPTVDTRPVYTNALANMVGKDKADKLIAETSLYGTTKKLPTGLQHTLLLTDLKFYWSKERTSFISTGPIGVGAAGKNYTGRLMEGKFEVIRRRSGDVLNLYFEPIPSVWFYFNYQRGVLQAYSSEEKFNTAIDGMKPEKRELKEKDGQEPYQFMLSTERKKSEFLKRMKESGL